MTTQPALAAEDMTAERVLDGDAPRKPARSRSRFAMERVNCTTPPLLAP